jgi:hypothetical protein
MSIWKRPSQWAFKNGKVAGPGVRGSMGTSSGAHAQKLTYNQNVNRLTGGGKSGPLADRLRRQADMSNDPITYRALPNMNAKGRPGSKRQRKYRRW